MGREKFKDGDIIATSIGAHIYNHDWPYVEKRLGLPENFILNKYKDQMKPPPTLIDLYRTMRDRKGMKFLLSIPNQMDKVIKI